MVTNHLLTRMILQVDNLKQPTSPHGFVPHQSLVFRVFGKGHADPLPTSNGVRGCHGGSLTGKLKKRNL